MPEDEFLTVTEAAVMLRFGDHDAALQSVRRLIRKGKLRASRVGKHYVIRRADVLAFVDALANLPAPPPTVTLAGGRVVDLRKAQ